jgi:hypothetical protein
LLAPNVERNRTGAGRGKIAADEALAVDGIAHHRDVLNPVLAFAEADLVSDPVLIIGPQRGVVIIRGQAYD